MAGDDLALDRALNPWMFDKSGKLTAAAQKQFPDAGSAPAAVTTGAGAGGTLKVDLHALHTAGQGASAVQAKVSTELGAPWEEISTAVTALMGWSTSAALNSAWSVWEQQYQSLAATLGTAAQALQDNANNTATTESGIAGHMRAVD